MENLPIRFPHTQVAVHSRFQNLTEYQFGQPSDCKMKTRIGMVLFLGPGGNRLAACALIGTSLSAPDGQSSSFPPQEQGALEGSRENVLVSPVPASAIEPADPFGNDSGHLCGQ